MQPLQDVVDFHVLPSGWCAVFLDFDAPAGQLPWRTEPVIGLAFVDLDDSGSPAAFPVIGGDRIQWTNDSIGLYRIEDMNRLDVLNHLRDLANLVEARRNRGQ